ncbi:MAG: sugar phosphate isomerase/epimerase family protein [Lentisphaeria bacterium]|jgi:sugar phosphate isomerase/epimerase
MIIGICGEPARSGLFAAMGFQFLEVNIQEMLVPLAPEAEFAPKLAELRSSRLPVKAANCFFPAGLKLTGPAVDPGRLLAYAATACERAGRAGIETLVLGSGGARQIPEGFPREAAGEQLLAFAKSLGPVAAKAGVTVVLEPLNSKECNVFNTVPECAAFVRQVNHPAIRLLVDAYHWCQEGEGAADLLAAAPLLAHAHLASCPNRRGPGEEACDYSAFFQALQAGGYAGRLAVEAIWLDLERNGAAAVRLLERLLAA